MLERAPDVNDVLRLEVDRHDIALVEPLERQGALGEEATCMSFTEAPLVRLQQRKDVATVVKVDREIQVHIRLKRVVHLNQKRAPFANHKLQMIRAIWS